MGSELCLYGIKMGNIMEMQLECTGKFLGTIMGICIMFLYSYTYLSAKHGGIMGIDFREI